MAKWFGTASGRAAGGKAEAWGSYEPRLVSVGWRAAAASLRTQKCFPFKRAYFRLVKSLARALTQCLPSSLCAQCSPFHPIDWAVRIIVSRYNRNSPSV